MKEYKKILFIHHATGWGGAPLNMINIINVLDKEKYDIKVLLLKDSNVKVFLQKSNIKYEIVTHWFYRFFYKYFSHTEPGHVKPYQINRLLRCSISWILSSTYFANRVLKKQDYDILHLNSSVLTDWLKPANKYGKVIIHIQEPLTKKYFGLRHKFFTNQMRKYADHIIAISKDNASRLEIKNKISVVYNFSDVEKIPEHIIDNYKTKAVLYLGGAAYIKGFFTLVNALQYIDKDITVYFAGNYAKKIKTETIRGRIKKVLREIKKIMTRKKENVHKALEVIRHSPNAQVLGLLSDVNEYIDKSVCLVSPFTQPHFSRPIIEAFARRKATIATKIEGMDEIIEDGENGILVEKDNPKQLAEKINYLCSNPKIAKKMGDKGYIVAVERYSADNVKQIEKIYKDLLNR